MGMPRRHNGDSERGILSLSSLRNVGMRICVYQSGVLLREGNSCGSHWIRTLAVESLVATVNQGKTYWKCRGGQFSKFGITVWPEVLEAANIKNLDSLKIYAMNGWHAEYILKDGKAEKVTKLTKIGT